jgi:hypothetical protein
MFFRTLPLLVAALLSGESHAQSQSPAQTPWHVTKTFEYRNDNLPGVPTASGISVASAPSGYTAVVEHLSVRCVAPSVLSIVYGEIIVRANPTDPGQSGKAGPAGVEDSASHPILFQNAYTGSTNVFVASQSLTARLNSPAWISHILTVTKSAGDALTVSCQISVSGYMEKQ